LSFYLVYLVGLDEQVVRNVLPNLPLGHSDHCAVDFTLLVQCVPRPMLRAAGQGNSAHNWYKADFAYTGWAKNGTVCFEHLNFVKY